jgi:hypothetical protein
MPSYRSILVPVRVVPAGKKRKCYHSPSHQILKGDLCLEVKDGMAWKGYCLSCAASMIRIARATLVEREESLNRQQ